MIDDTLVIDLIEQNQINKLYSIIYNKKLDKISSSSKEIIIEQFLYNSEFFNYFEVLRPSSLGELFEKEIKKDPSLFNIVLDNNNMINSKVMIKMINLGYMPSSEVFVKNIFSFDNSDVLKCLVDHGFTPDANVFNNFTSFDNELIHYLYKKGIDITEALSKFPIYDPKIIKEYLLKNPDNILYIRSYVDNYKDYAAYAILLGASKKVLLRCEGILSSLELMRFLINNNAKYTASVDLKYLNRESWLELIDYGVSKGYKPTKHDFLNNYSLMEYPYFKNILDKIGEFEISSKKL